MIKLIKNIYGNYKNYKICKEEAKKRKIQDRLKNTVTQNINVLKKGLAVYDKDEVSKVETFDEYLKRNKLTEEQLNNIHNNNYKTARIYFFAFLFLCLYNLTLLISGTFYIQVILLTLFIFLLFFQKSFFCYQIENRELSNLKSFIRNYKNIIPKNPKNKK